MAFQTIWNSLDDWVGLSLSCMPEGMQVFKELLPENTRNIADDEVVNIQKVHAFLLMPVLIKDSLT